MARPDGSATTPLRSACCCRRSALRHPPGRSDFHRRQHWLSVRWPPSSSATAAQLPSPSRRTAPSSAASSASDHSSRRTLGATTFTHRSRHMAGVRPGTNRATSVQASPHARTARNRRRSSSGEKYPLTMDGSTVCSHRRRHCRALRPGSRSATCCHQCSGLPKARTASRSVASSPAVHATRSMLGFSARWYRRKQSSAERPVPSSAATARHAKPLCFCASASRRRSSPLVHSPALGADSTAHCTRHAPGDRLLTLAAMARHDSSASSTSTRSSSSE
mmetsp:Transcript_13137/g.45961  ORF Transcript_13137/g.45961 Transcript_13137/m.45961 type:complete len:277 (+) Transcript_13137:589-1419(+)